MQPFFVALMDSLVVELKGTKDFSKLLTGLSILGYVASLSEPIKSQSFSQLISFLAHRYPKVTFLLIISGNIVPNSSLIWNFFKKKKTCYTPPYLRINLSKN